jgi:GNAT superfamily N-acetyltransferase
MPSSNRFCHFGGWKARTSAAPAKPWAARPARPEDFEAWEELFAGYCEFYERPSTAAHRRLVWSWIEAGTIHCLLAVPAATDNDGAGPSRAPGGSPAAAPPLDADGPPAAAWTRAVGLAHLRPAPSPLRGAMTGFLDDLFVAPAARGTGAFECLMAAARDLAAAEGWAGVRWITAADNLRAQAAYDRVATRTNWVTYQLDA